MHMSMGVCGGLRELAQHLGNLHAKYRQERPVVAIYGGALRLAPWAPDWEQVAPSGSVLPTRHHVVDGDRSTNRDVATSVGHGRRLALYVLPTTRKRKDAKALGYESVSAHAPLRPCALAPLRCHQRPDRRSVSRTYIRTAPSVSPLIM